jgi:hypothetical protein
MPGFGYTIVLYSKKSLIDKSGKSVKDESGKQVYITNQLLKSQDIDKVNTILGESLKNPSYGCDIDHIMLFSTVFSNWQEKIQYGCVYIISKVQIKHKLFLSDSSLNTLLNSRYLKVDIS